MRKNLFSASVALVLCALATKLAQATCTQIGTTTVNCNGSDDGSITNAVVVTTNGNNVPALWVKATGGNATVSNTGSLTTNGAGSSGIFAESTGGNAKVTASGNISINDAAGNPAGHGISAVTQGGPGKVAQIDYNDANGIIRNASGSADTWNTASGFRAEASGNGSNAVVVVENVKQIEMIGSGSAGIAARAAAGNTGGNLLVMFQNGEIVNTGAGSADGISAEHSGTGNVTVESHGNITINGGNGACWLGQCPSEAIYGLAVNGNSTITASGTIKSNSVAQSGSDGVIAQTRGDNNYATIFFGAAQSGSSVTTRADNAWGLGASSLGSGDALVRIEGQNTRVVTSGNNAPAVSAIAYNGNARIDTSATTHVTTTGIHTAGLVTSSPNGVSTLTNSGEVTSSTSAIQVLAAQTATITNTVGGILSAQDDYVIQGSSTTRMSLTNAGRMTGYLNFSGGGPVNLINATTGTWSLRHFAPAAPGGVGTKDTLRVAVSDFGGSGNNRITNDGTLTLLGDGGTATTLDATGAYATGYAANTMAMGGPVQGQLLNVQQFTHSGLIDLQASPAVGDVLLISGGTFTSNGGRINLDTVLNEGGANSESDMLVVDSTSLGSAATKIKVNNLGGQGLQTVDDGIEIVRVLDASQSAADVFKLSNRVVAGAYQYDLYQGGVGENADNGNWYLRSELAPRAETGSYVANMAAANKMFNLRLEDREGRAENSSMWLRQQGDRTKFRAGSGQVKTATNTYVIQGGGEVVHAQFGADDRLGVGLMLGYGTSSSESVNGHSDYRSKGKVDGYSGGVYATWYQDVKTLDGLYVDSWVQYSLLDAEVNGEQLASESYDMKGWSASVESGYRMPVYQGENSRVFVTPQAQITWNGVKADDHREANGTRVSSNGDNNVQTRLGVKLSRDGVSTMDKGRDKLFTVYTEANWLYNTERVGATMNGVTIRQAGSNNIGELKVGVEGQLNKHANVWTNVAQQMGNDGYSDTALTVGFKYKF